MTFVKRREFVGPPPNAYCMPEYDCRGDGVPVFVGWVSWLIKDDGFRIEPMPDTGPVSKIIEIRPKYT